jgi:hypothetical protein
MTPNLGGKERGRSSYLVCRARIWGDVKLGIHFQERRVHKVTHTSQWVDSGVEKNKGELGMAIRRLLQYGNKCTNEVIRGRPMILNQPLWRRRGGHGALGRQRLRQRGHTW